MAGFPVLPVRRLWPLRLLSNLPPIPWLLVPPPRRAARQRRAAANARLDPLRHQWQCNRRNAQRRAAARAARGRGIQTGGAANDAVASLPTDDNPNSLYQAAYQYLMSGDYKAAEAGFREHVKRYPADPMTAEARFWLGESLYGQGRYPEAATLFIDTQRGIPIPSARRKTCSSLAWRWRKWTIMMSPARPSRRFPNAIPRRRQPF